MSLNGEFLDHTFECGCNASTALNEQGQQIFMYVACPLQEQCPNTIMMFKAVKETGKPVIIHRNSTVQ